MTDPAMPEVLEQPCAAEERGEEDGELCGPKEERFAAIDRASLPPTYVRNSQRELLLLDYAGAFETQFLTQFPSHKPLHICPLNEGGVPKFLPTSLRPAVLARSALLGGAALARFVADALVPEPLADPTRFSKYCQSPQTTLEFQRGDALDASLLLCSLLLGAGFNAYVVLGAADRFLTCNWAHKRNAPEREEVKRLEEMLRVDYAG